MSGQRASASDGYAAPGAAGVCPSEETVARFVDGELDGAQLDGFHAHLDGCGRCRRVVAAVGAGRSGETSARAEESGERASSPMPPRGTGSASSSASGESASFVDVGTVVGGKYRVLREIGSGGMGKVFAALHEELGQTVAIKVMHAAMLTDTDSMRRFLREGKSAALLRSDHAVRIIDVGRLASGLPYIVMEHLEGEDLDSLRAREVLSVEDVVSFMLEAMSAIGEAHDAGLAHRDVKPQNLFLARVAGGKRRVKVLDFGLAKELPSIQSSNSSLTTDNMILGSPHYMSPEQIRTPASVDARADIWGIGASLFKLLTGVPPFSGTSIHGLLARILADTPPRASSLRADVPKALDDVIARCLEKDLAKRFPSVAELAEALAAAVSSKTSVPRGERQPAPAPTIIDVRLSNTTEPLGRRFPSHVLEVTRGAPLAPTLPSAQPLVPSSRPTTEPMSHLPAPSAATAVLPASSPLAPPSTSSRKSASSVRTLAVAVLAVSVVLVTLALVVARVTGHGAARSTVEPAPTTGASPVAVVTPSVTPPGPSSAPPSATVVPDTSSSSMSMPAPSSAAATASAPSASAPSATTPHAPPAKRPSITTKPAAPSSSAEDDKVWGWGK